MAGVLPRRLVSDCTVIEKFNFECYIGKIKARSVCEPIIKAIEFNRLDIVFSVY